MSTVDVDKQHMRDYHFNYTVNHHRTELKLPILSIRLYQGYIYVTSVTAYYG